MSMRDYGVDDFGYVFTEEMIDKMIEAYRPDGIAIGDTHEMAEHMGLDYIGEFTGDVWCLDDNGCDDYRNTECSSYSNECLFFFPLERQPTLFRAAYRSPEELAKDMKNTYGKWLPESLKEIYKGMRHIVGTYYG